jgi:putative transposase
MGISRQAIDKQARVFRMGQHQRELLVHMVMRERILHPRMGTLKLYDLLKHQLLGHELKCGRDKLGRILREEGLLVKRRRNYTHTTNSYHCFRKYPNLIKELEIGHPDQVYVNDITYIKVASRYMYLALTTDAYSKQIMGYYLSDDESVKYNGIDKNGYKKQ